MNLQLRTNAILEKMNKSFIDLTGEVYTQSPLTGTPNKFIHGLKVIQRETEIFIVYSLLLYKFSTQFQAIHEQ